MGTPARHDIEDVFGAQAAAFQYQLNSHQHRIEPGDRYGSQNLRHDPVTAGMTPQTVLKHDIEDVFGAQAAAFQYQLNSHQHRIEPGDRYGSALPSHLKMSRQRTSWMLEAREISRIAGWRA